MSVKVDFGDAKKDIDKFKKQAKIRLQKELSSEIKDSILRGVSPVKGFRRFKKYSNSYKAYLRKNRIKKISPVNLELSGDLLDSLKIEPNENGLRVSFDNELADIHNNKGAGKSKVIRRMLPTKRNEKFNRSITIRIREVLNAIAKNIFKR